MTYKSLFLFLAAFTASVSAYSEERAAASPAKKALQGKPKSAAKKPLTNPKPTANVKPAPPADAVAKNEVNNGKVVEKIIAIVNNDLVLLSDLNDFTNKIKSNGLVDDALLEFYDRKKLAESNETRIQFLVDEKVIDTEVSRQGIQAPIEKVEGEIRNILNNRGVTREQLKETLAKRGVKFSDYQDFIKTGIQRQSLIEREVSSKIKISDDDIATYYIQKNLSSKPLVFEFTLSHIVFLVPKDADQKAGMAAAKAKAEALKAKLAAGGNFEALASQYSEDPNFTQGGQFGNFRMGDLVPSVEKAVYKLSPGETSDVVQMADGYHVFKVLKRSLVPSNEFERRKNEIASILFKDAFQRQFRVWLEALKRTSYIKVNS